MTRIKHFLLFFFLVTMAANCQHNTKPPCAENAIALFNGESLDGWKTTEFGTQGPVLVRDNTLILGAGDGCTGVTFQKEFPKMNYVVTLEAKRISGSDFFCGMTFPFNEEFVTLILGGWGGSVVGLSSIGGLDASENETGVMKRFVQNQWYSIKLEVIERGIKVWIDDMLAIDFLKDERPLSVRSEVLLSRPLGISSWKTTAALRNVCLQKLTDK